MSENSLKKHIDNGTTRVNNTLNFTPAFVSDSKGRYLKSYASSDQIKLFCKSGADWDDIKDCGSKITFKNSLQNIQESGFTFVFTSKPIWLISPLFGENKWNWLIIRQIL